MGNHDDFSDDLNTPTEDDLEKCYGSKYLGASDLGKKKIKARILKITMETMPSRDGKPERAKLVLYLSNIDKPMVLNATNKNRLVDELGRKPADWLNAEIGLYTELTQFGGKSTPGLRLNVLSKRKTASNKSTAKLVEETPPADEDGDPGFGEAVEFGEPAE
jgi:hypothetical protein